MKLKVLDPVVLTEDLASAGLKSGDMGTIVEVYSVSDFEVEFVKASGHTQALLTLHMDQIRPVCPRDIPSVRSLDAA